MTETKMTYVIDILVRHLVDEEEYLNYGIPQNPRDKPAFEESARIAKERIPQLREAIRILSKPPQP